MRKRRRAAGKSCTHERERENWKTKKKKKKNLFLIVCENGVLVFK